MCWKLTQISNVRVTVQYLQNILYITCTVYCARGKLHLKLIAQTIRSLRVTSRHHAYRRSRPNPSRRCRRQQSCRRCPPRWSRHPGSSRSTCKPFTHTTLPPQLNVRASDSLRLSRFSVPLSSEHRARTSDVSPLIWIRYTWKIAIAVHAQYVICVSNCYERMRKITSINYRIFVCVAA